MRNIKAEGVGGHSILDVKLKRLGVVAVVGVSSLLDHSPLVFVVHTNKHVVCIQSWQSLRPT